MRNSSIEILRKDDCIEVWLPPINNPEGELLMIVHTSYVPDLIAELKHFEQSEGRLVKR